MLLLRGASPHSGSVYRRRCFNTCSSCEEQSFSPCELIQLIVSIHAPLARSKLSPLIGVIKFVFQYMLLLRGASDVTRTSAPSKLFQYMLLLRGAIGKRSVENADSRFNTCSSCEEQIKGQLVNLQPSRFNTCSSCEEQDSPGVAEREARFKIGEKIRSCEEQDSPGVAERLIAVSIHAPLARSKSATIGGLSR